MRLKNIGRGGASVNLLVVDIIVQPIHTEPKAWKAKIIVDCYVAYAQFNGAKSIQAKVKIESMNNGLSIERQDIVGGIYNCQANKLE